uniref:Uncharacterized protein n=1 Tax=viral metagenome TaxID=1070528 RepID=A0A6C0DZW2_9ZZZZ
MDTYISGGTREERKKRKDDKKERRRSKRREKRERRKERRMTSSDSDSSDDANIQVYWGLLQRQQALAQIGRYLAKIQQYNGSVAKKAEVTIKLTSAEQSSSSSAAAEDDDKSIISDTYPSARTDKPAPSLHFDLRTNPKSFSTTSSTTPEHKSSRAESTPYAPSIVPSSQFPQSTATSAIFPDTETSLGLNRDALSQPIIPSQLSSPAYQPAATSASSAQSSQFAQSHETQTHTQVSPDASRSTAEIQPPSYNRQSEYPASAVASSSAQSAPTPLPFLSPQSQYKDLTDEELTIKIKELSALGSIMEIAKLYNYIADNKSHLTTLLIDTILDNGTNHNYYEYDSAPLFDIFERFNNQPNRKFIDRIYETIQFYKKELETYITNSKLNPLDPLQYQNIFNKYKNAIFIYFGTNRNVTGPNFIKFKQARTLKQQDETDWNTYTNFYNDNILPRLKRHPPLLLPRGNFRLSE